MYFINAITLWFTGKINWGTLRYALRERPIAVAGKGGYHHVDPQDLMDQSSPPQLPGDVDNLVSSAANSAYRNVAHLPDGAEYDDDIRVEADSIAKAVLCAAFSEARRVPFVLGNQYQQQDGKWVRFVAIHNAGTSYETMVDEDGVNRYTARDFGRCTGSAHDYSCPQNVPPLYHAAMPA